MWHCHNSPCGGHYGGDKTVAKVLQSGFFWLTLFKDAYHHVLKCDQCERMGEFPEGMRCLYKTLWKLKFLIVGVLISWALFPSSAGTEYILVAVDYVSKWVEAMATTRNDV